MSKINIGDKLVWGNDPSGKVYEILDIRPNSGAILWGWMINGIMYTGWSHSVSSIEELINKGEIRVINKNTNLLLPKKNISKFSFNHEQN